jgi:AraC-like DNA-binding protein
MELGLRGAQKASLGSLRPAQQAAIMNAQTGLKRLEALAALSRYEDSALEMNIWDEGDDLRIICTMKGLSHHVFVCLAEWLNLQAVISVIRSVVGASWCPSEITFVSPMCPPDAVHAAFPNTRIIVGQSHASVVVTREDLARRTSETIESSQDTPASMSSKEVHDGQSAWEFVSLIRMIVQPYLNGGSIDLAFTAEMAGIGARTMQRRLKLSGSSYSQIIQEARFELACTQLDDQTMKIIDIAMMVGYESPQHFTRAFRRFTGLTPSQYRSKSFKKAS